MSPPVKSFFDDDPPLPKASWHSNQGDEGGRVCLKVTFSFASLSKQQFLHTVYFPLSLQAFVEMNALLLSLSRKGKHDWQLRVLHHWFLMVLHSIPCRRNMMRQMRILVQCFFFLSPDVLNVRELNTEVFDPKTPNPKETNLWRPWCWRHHPEKVVCRCLTMSQCQCGFQAFPRHANSEVLEWFGYVV